MSKLSRAAVALTAVTAAGAVPALVARGVFGVIRSDRTKGRGVDREIIECFECH